MQNDKIMFPNPGVLGGQTNDLDVQKKMEFFYNNFEPGVSQTPGRFQLFNFGSKRKKWKN